MADQDVLVRLLGKAFGPLARSHAIELPKKVRALALKHALSAKAKSEAIVVVDELTAKGEALLPIVHEMRRFGHDWMGCGVHQT